MKEERWLTVYKLHGKWCDGDINDFSKPIIKESMLSAKYKTLHALLDACRARHYEQTGEKSDLTIRDILMLYPKNGNCPVLDVPLELTVYKKRHDTIPSFDKIVPSQGYMQGNVRIISWLANRVKKDKTKPEFFFDKAKKQYNIYKGLGVYLEREIRPDYEI